MKLSKFIEFESAESSAEYDRTKTELLYPDLKPFEKEIKNNLIEFFNTTSQSRLGKYCPWKGQKI